MAQVALTTAALAGTAGALESATVAHAATASPFPSGPTSDPAVVAANAAIFGLSMDDRSQYLDALDQLAAEIGPRVGVESGRLVETWATTDEAQMRVVLSALTQLGVPYRYASSRPGVAFDCSGLVRWAWSQGNVSLPAQSGSIIRALPDTSTEELEPGDVLWYPGHVMMSLGVDNVMVHAVNRGRPVEVDNVPDRQLRRLRVIDPLG